MFVPYFIIHHKTHTTSSSSLDSPFILAMTRNKTQRNRLPQGNPILLFHVQLLPVGETPTKRFHKRCNHQMNHSGSKGPPWTQSPTRPKRNILKIMTFKVHTGPQEPLGAKGNGFGPVAWVSRDSPCIDYDLDAFRESITTADLHLRSSLVREQKWDRWVESHGLFDNSL